MTDRGGAASEAADYVAITRLQAAYADVVSRRAWPELEPLFAPQAQITVDTVTRPAIDLTGAAALGEFIASGVERFEFFEFVILNTVLELSPAGTASGRLWMVEVRQDRATGEWSNAFGLYRDDYAAFDGRWTFARRRYQSLARRTGADPAEVFPVPLAGDG